jgi:glutamine synthetase
MNPKLNLKGLSYVEMQFVDLLGKLRVIDITPERYVDSLTVGKVFDGSSVNMAPLEQSDLILKPVKSTFFRLPWNKKAARVLCDIYLPDGHMEEHKLSPRYILKNQLKLAREKGVDFYTAVENEFFILDQDELIDNSGYFFPTPLDRTKNLRESLFELLPTKTNIAVEYMHHEVAPGQGEITLKVNRALEMADDTIAFRYVAQNVANTDGLLFTLMPKLKAGINGSGMHVHMSLSDLNGRNLFYSDDGDFNLSGTARNFIGGVLDHYKSLVGLAAPSINSRKRLVPGFEAPVNKGWGPKNRSALIRIPFFQSEKSARIEFRVPDSTSNPYLLFTGLLAAGMEGIEKKIEPGDPCFVNTYENFSGETIPATQEEVIEELEKDRLMETAVGKEALSIYLRILKKELEEYSSSNGKWDPAVITAWEKEKYLQM